MLLSFGFSFVLIIYISYVKSNINLCENDLVGLYPPVFSTYYDNETINVEIVPKYAKFLADNGIPGVLLLGTNGEGPLVALKDRMLLTNAWMAAAKQYNLQVILQVAGLPFPDSLKLAKFAGETGVNAILALPEQYYRPVRVNELVYYINLLAAQAPNTPISYYDNTEVSEVSLNMLDFFTNATCLIPNFLGLKTLLETALEVQAHTQLRSYQRIFAMTDVALSSVFELNVNGTISTICNIFPQLCTEIVTAVQSGNLSKTRDLQLELNKRVDAILSLSGNQDTGYMVGLFKATLEIVTGIKVGNLRAPLDDLISYETKRAIAQNLLDIGVEIAQKDKYYES